MLGLVLAGTVVLAVEFLVALGLQQRWAVSGNRKIDGAPDGEPQLVGIEDTRLLLFAGLLSCFTAILVGFSMTIPLSLWSGTPFCFPALLVIIIVFMAFKDLRSGGSLATTTIATAFTIIYALVMIIVGIAVEEMFLFNGLNVLPFALLCAFVLAVWHDGGGRPPDR